jgi:AcrR family transcriptional regulator
MARPANADPADTQQRLLSAAIWLFARHGFDGASTRELAARAGVNIATLNYYFQSKRGLFDACVDDIYRRLGRRATTLFVDADPTDLELILDRLYVAARAERDGVRVLVRQILDGGRLTPRTEAKHFLPELDNTAKLAASLWGCSPERARSAAVTLTYLVSRFVIQDEGSLITAFGARDAADAHARVIAMLATTARAILGRKKDKE